MFEIHNYTGFIAAIVAFQIIPGPETLAILNATARHGIRAGMGAVLGTLTGDLLFMLGAALAARPVIFSSLQGAGIVYLGWLGLKLLRAPIADGGAEVGQTRSGWTCFRGALAVCLTNPKAIMFFMAFFPLFLTPDARPHTLVVMMGHVSLISLLYQTGLVLVGNAAAVRLSRYRCARVLATRLVGLGLFGFSVKLAIDRR